MPPEFLPQPSPEPGKDVAAFKHASTASPHVEAQLNQPADVSQAHQFFQGATQPVNPGVTEVAGGGQSLLQNSLNGTLPPLQIGDAASLAGIPNGILPGGEHAISGKAALAAMSAEKALVGAGMGAPLAPGAEQGVSPLIQLIMKMPGLTGVMDSFFDFLKALFEGDIMNSLTSALLDPTGMLLHLFQDGGSDFLVPVEVISKNPAFLKFNDGMFMPSDASSSVKLHSELLDDAHVGAPINDLALEDAIFEKTSNYTITDHHQQSVLDWRGQNHLALGPDAAYRPTMHNYQSPGATTSSTSSASQTLSQQASNNASGGAAHHGSGAAQTHHAPRHFKAQDVPPNQMRIAQPSAGAGAEAGSSQYTVQSGDNLWDIAKRELGDGARWGEIYKANADVIGQNPQLIQPGMTLQMPDANSIAAAGGRYIVQPGDNLWDIAKHNLGGGENWGQIYGANQSVIGSNPDLIYPGQSLQLGGDNVGAIADTAGAENIAAPAVSVQPSAPAASTTAASTPATVEPGTDQQLYTAQDGSLFYRSHPQ